MQVKQFTTEDAAYADSLELRERYLRKPLGLSLADEDLTVEKDQLHFGIFDGYRLLGSVTFKKLSVVRLKLRQMVIDESEQGRGLGFRLVKDAEEELATMGFKEIEMAARMTAEGFYEKLGYEAVGDVFTEVKIEHVTMVKQLRG